MNRIVKGYRIDETFNFTFYVYQGQLSIYSLPLSSQWSCEITVVKSILERRKKTQKVWVVCLGSCL